MKRLMILAVLMASPALPAGVVRQSFGRIGNNGNYVLTFSWTADSKDGSVPVTTAQLTPPSPGFRIDLIEITSGSPAPTTGYSVRLLDASMNDLMGGSASAIKVVTPTSLAGPTGALIPNGVIRLSILGQKVPAAVGTVVIYMAQPGSAVGPSTATPKAVSAGGIPASKSNKAVNVTEFGAHCNDSSFDDRPGIQAAILAVDQSEGGTVAFPPGATCYLNSYTGPGRSTTMVWFSSGDANGWKSTNLTLQGNGATIVSRQASNSVMLGNSPQDKSGINQGCTLVGCGTLENLTVLGMTKVKKGDSTIRLDVPSNAARFHVGDAVYIRGGIAAGGVGQPMTNIPNAEINEITEINTATGTLALKWPAQKAYPNEYDPRLGTMPTGIVDIAPYTSTNLLIENLKLSTPANTLLIVQTVGATLRNVDMEYTGDGAFVSGNDRQILWDAVRAVDPNPCRGGIYQIARSTVDVEIRDSYLEAGNSGCGLINNSEGSADVRIHNNTLKGHGQVGGSAFMDFSLIDNEIDIDSGADFAIVTTCCGGEGYNIQIHGNRIVTPGSAPLGIGKTLRNKDYPGFVFSGNTVISGAAKDAITFTGGPGVVEGNTIFTSNPTAACIDIAGGVHAITISGNLCIPTQPSPAPAIAVEDAGPQTSGPVIRNNQLSDYAAGIVVRNQSHETGIVVSDNITGKGTAPKP